MIVMLVALTVIGDLVALVGAIVVGRVMLDIDWSTMYYSFADNLKPYDFLHGVYKSIAFGGAIAMSSCYFGVTVRGGAVGVGRAVNAAVVAAAVSIMLLDFFLTYLVGMSLARRIDRARRPRARTRCAPARELWLVYVVDDRRARARTRGSRPQRPARGEVARQMYAIGNRSLVFIVVTLGLHRHGDDLPGVPAARARHRRLLAGRHAVPPPDRRRTSARR